MKTIAAALANTLEVFYAIILLQLIANTGCNQSDQFEGFFLCRSCGFEVTRSSMLISVPSQLAHRQRNDSLAGSDTVLIQLFKNPNGKYFEVISSSAAEIQKVNEAHLEHSWFPGFTWTIAVCPYCGQHLGWVFDPMGRQGGSDPSNPDQVKHHHSFIGLILGNLIHEQETNFIAVPKTYYS